MNNEIIEMFPEEPFTAPTAISAEERAYNDAFASRLPDILKRRKIAQAATERDVAINSKDVRTVYAGVLITEHADDWHTAHVETVIWRRVWGADSPASMAA